MMNFKKFGLFLCVIVLLLSGITLSAFAEEVKQTDENKELDLVVVIDKSGSMADSDKQKQTLSATNLLITLMPANSRIGVITFGESAENILADMENGGLVSREDEGNVATIKSKVSNIQYDAEWTGMGNGLKKAKELLASNGRSDSQKAIFLFSDGTDDFGTGINAERKMAECTDNATDTVLWAQDNNCPIYCIGYNYNGSMAEGSEGFAKLKNYASSTNGEAQCMSNIGDIHNYFMQVLQVLTNAKINEGKWEFTIDSSVAEANIIITGNNAEEISKVELYNPSGKKVSLGSSDNSRYSQVENIGVVKLISPVSGTWQFKYENKDNLKISFILYQNIGLVSSLKYPEGNPSETAYQGDTINVCSYLTTKENSRITEEALYKTIKEATITAIPVNNQEKKQIVNMSYSNGEYNGSFTVSENCAYNVTVQLSSDTFVRKNTFTVTSSNHPLVLSQNIDKVKVLKNKEKTIENIYQYVSDPEGDKITATVSAGDLSIAEPEIKDDNLVIKGKKWGSTTVKVQYKDAQGNTVDSTFKVKVIDLLALAIIVLVFLLIIALIIFLIVLFIKRNKRFIGKLALMNMEIRDGDQMVQIEPEKDSETNLPYEDEYIISLGGVLTSKAKRNLKAVITHLLKALEFTTKDDEEKFIDCFYSENDLMIKLLSIIQFEPTFRGTKGFDVIISQEKEAKRILKQHGRIEINDQNRSVRVVIGEQLCVKLFNEKDQCIFSVEFKYIRNI